MKLDLHVHAEERSPCSIASEIDLIETAIDYGLDGLAFTDHHRLISQPRLKQLNKRYAPFRIFAGIEIRINSQDFLVYGIQSPKLEEEDWTYPELYEFVQDNGGAIVLAHPYRFRAHLNVDVTDCPPDAVELHSTNIRDGKTEQRLSLIDSLGSQPICNSDAHEAKDVGMFYNEFARPVTDDKELVKLLQQGNYSCQQR